FGFTGKEYDPDTGLYYFNARWYDSELGRFISADPAADPQNPNLYSYCGNNPVIRSDPDGQFWQIIIGALIGGFSSERNGGDFWTGALMGAISGGISMGVNNALVNWAGMSANALGTNVLSGAISGGITSEAFGGDFWSGAGQGALMGGVSWQVNKWFGNTFDKWAGDSRGKQAVANGAQNVVTAVFMRQDAGLAFVNGTFASYSRSVVNKYKPTAKEGTQKVTAEQLKELGWKNVTDDVVESLNNTLKKYDITTPERIRHFLSQCMQETNKGQWPTEQDFGDKGYFQRMYDGRKDLGNQPGDGIKYRGGGAIHLTGKNQYKAFADAMDDPRIMEGADYVAKNYFWEAGGYWWKTHGMNAIIDSGASVRQVTKMVNGGYNGLSNREFYYNLCRKVIK
ncbi:RHS repeat-associated protein, partial [Hydrogenispora ethanolica]